MKSILIIGMGKFGHHLCEDLIAQGNDVMIVDKEESRVTDMISKVTNVQIGDCTNPSIVKSIGVENFDIVFICIGANFQSSLEITSLVKEMGAPLVISKANRDVHAKFLSRNGADRVIYPDRDIADKIARECSRDSVFDYVDLEGEYTVYEIAVFPSWIGKTLKQLDIRRKYNLSIIGIKTDGVMNILPNPDAPFSKENHLMILGTQTNIDKLLQKFDKN